MNVIERKCSNLFINSYRPFPFFVDNKMITSGPEVRISNNAPS